MRKVGLWLGALLSLCVLLVVSKRDHSALDPATQARIAIARAAFTNAPTRNWTNATVRFREAAVLEIQDRFDPLTEEKVVVEIVKTKGKYPFIGVETRFQFDAQANAWIPNPPMEYVADQVLVELKPGVTEQQLADALKKVEGRIVQKHPAGESTLVLIGLPKPTADAVPNAIANLVRARRVFDVVEPHLIRRATAEPNDAYFAQQWGLQMINAPAAWDIQRGRAGVVVAVVDSGIDYNHPDLAPRVWANPGERPGNYIDDDLNGYVDDYRAFNFAYENNNPYDDLNHGTFVSGLIGAAANNGAGIAGVCWDVRIMPIKVMDSDGLLYAIDEIRGFDYARMEGAKIINASLGGYYTSQSEYNAISRLRSAGVLLVAAAGNDGINNDLRPNYPSSYGHDNIIAVAYSDQNDNLSPNANIGARTVDLAAPGVNVFSTDRFADYRFGSGSSFAAPHVAGVAALVKAEFPNASYAKIRSTLLNNTDRRTAFSGRTATGGRLNAYEALISRIPLPEALDSGSLVWQSGGARPWFGYRLESSDGVDSARCGNVTDGQFSWVQTTVKGPGRLTFNWAVSSEEFYDELIFVANGQAVAAISGETPWEELAFDLFEGTYTLRWIFVKDSYGSSGADKAWLDQVSYIRDTGGPTITITSPSGPNLYASDVLLEGTCSDLFGVASLECRLINSNGTGDWQTVDSADDFVTWQAQLTGLALGTNTVRFRAVDTLSQTSIVNRTYVVLSPLTVNIAGCGNVDAKFAGTTWQQAGKTLTIRATPCPGNLFTHWSGDITSSNATLSFVMQPDLTLQANFVVNPFTPVTGFYNGLFHDSAGVLHESSGLFKMTLTATGGFTGSIVADGKTNKFSSRFDPVSGTSSFPIPRVGKTTLQASLQLDFNDQVTGQLGDGNWTADLIADRAVFNATTNPAPSAGMYTLVFPGSTDFTASPGGHGFATAILNAAGQVSVDGRLGDSTRVRQTIPISKNGDWPFYVPLYAGSKGSALGWLKFETPPGFTNLLTSWIRPYNSAAVYYRAGFSNELSVIGSPYSVPGTGTRVIDCTNALLILSGADFATPITNNMTLTASNTVSNDGPYNASMRIVRTNGTFTGKLILPRRTNTFQGVFLQQQNIGLGYFIGSNYVGEVRFEPGQ